MNLSLAEIAFLSLKRKKLRTILLVIGVMISISILTGVNAGLDGLQKSYRDLVTTSLGYTDLIVESNTTSNTFQMSPVELLLRDDLVSTYSWRVQYATPFTSQNGSFTQANWAYFSGADPNLDEEFGNYLMLEGNFTSMSEALKNQTNACALNEYYAQRMGLKPGDTLYVGTYNLTKPFPPTQPQKAIQLTVMAVIRDNGRVYWFDPKNPSNFQKVNTDIFLNLATAQELLDLPITSATQVYVHVTDLTKADTATLGLQERLGSNYSIANLKGGILASVEQIFANNRSMGFVVGGISLMITAMLLLNSMFMAMSERKYDLGVLRSMGASKGQVFLMFLIEIFLITVAGALASIPLSIATTKMITTLLPTPYIQNVGSVSTGIEFVFSLNTIVFSLATGMAITVLMGLIPSIAAARVNIVQAIHPHIRTSKISRRWRVLAPIAGVFLIFAGLYFIKTGFAATGNWVPGATALVGYTTSLVGAVLLASSVLSAFSRGFSYFVRPFMGETSILIHRHIIHNFRRSVFALGAFAISIALMISLSSLVTTVASYDLKVQKYNFGADVQMWVSAPPSFTDEIKSTNGVKNAAGAAYIWYSQSNMSANGLHLRNGGVRLLAVDSAEFFNTIYSIHLTATLNVMTPDQVYSTLISQPNTIILQDTLAKNLSANIGDNVTWTFKNATQTFEKNFRVIAITDLVAGAWETLYKSSATTGYYMAIVRFDEIARLRSPTEGGTNFDQFYIALGPSANTTQVVDELSQKCRAYGYSPWIAAVQDTLQSVQNSYNQIEALAISMTAFLLIISVLGIMAAMVYTILERKREIGILMALGLDKRQNATITIGETVLLSLLGTTIGMVSGVSLSLFVLQAIPWWTSLPPPSLIFSSWTLFVVVITVIFSALISSVYPANRVVKLRVVDALRK
jgi:ABC-type lipoprotein release transport system permease subunit